VSVYSDLILAESGLVAYWRLGEPLVATTADDAKGTNDGTYNGVITRGEAGALRDDADTAAKFDGATGWVEVPDANALDTGDVFTIEAWIKRNSTSGDQCIATKFNTGGWNFWITGGALTLRKVAVANIVSATSTPGADGKWHHVVATKNGATVKLYVDGQDVTGTVANQTIVNTTGRFSIGAASPTTNFWNGWIDEVAHYNTALSAAKVAEHYSIGRSRFGAAALSGTASLAASSLRVRSGVANLSGEAALAVASRRERTGTATLMRPSVFTSVRKLFGSVSCPELDFVSFVSPTLTRPSKRPRPNGGGDRGCHGCVSSASRSPRSCDSARFPGHRPCGGGGE
jgi:hypothetical protein